MKRFLFIYLLLIVIFSVKAQNVTILPNGITPAMGTYPRISYDEILALPNPMIGDMAYDTTFKCLRVYTGNKWLCSYQNPANYTPNIVPFAVAGGSNYDSAEGVAVDGLGNVYLMGFYENTAYFGSTSVTSMGNEDIFLVKYNSNGTVQWALSAGGTSSDLGFDIKIDGLGNIYLTGIYSGTATFGTTSITSIGNKDIFVAKYNSNGILQWIQSAGGAGNDVGLAITADNLGNVYITGYYQGTATFGASTILSVGNDDIFVAKYNSNGTLQWVEAAGGINTDFGHGIAVDGFGDIYITGNYTGTVTFGSTPKTSAGGSDIFIAKYNSNGILQWVRSAGGTGGDYGQNIVVDGSNNVYITGSYEGTSYFGSPTPKTSVGSNDIFVAKYNSTGALLWVQSAGGASIDSGYGIAVDGSGNVYVTGEYQGIATFGATSIISSGFSDIFVTKYNSSGIFQWVQTAGGTINDYGESIAVDGFGNTYVSGYTQGNATFGATSISVGPIFITRLDK